MSFLLTAALTALVTSIPATAATSVPNIMKVTPAQWASLNESVGGRLAAGRPMFSPCYLTYNGSHNTQINLAECNAIQTNKTNGQTIVNYIGGYMESVWGGCSTTGDKCPLSFALPDIVNPLVGNCMQGQVADYYIAVSGPADVQAGLAFTQKYNIPVVIKNTGHDYKGRSAAPNALALWTHTHQPPIYATKEFVPAGCSTSVGDVITFGAGQSFEGIYEFAEANNYTIVGGSSTTVGAAGGWITGGGHSSLSPTLGLGVDNVQQLTAVLPNGSYVTTSRCQNQDLFFALRGGGGGTFGVIMEMTTKAHPRMTFQAATFEWSTLTPDSLSELLAILVANGPRWHDEGWGGYINPAVLTSALSAMTLITPILNNTAAISSMAPLFNFTRSLSHPGSGNVTEFSSFYPLFTSRFGGLERLNNAGELIASRLVPRETFESQPTELVDVLASFAADEGISHGELLPIFICATTPNPKYVVDDGTSSITPAWRNSTWHVITFTTFPTTAPPETIAGHFQVISQRVQPLRALTPTSGAYQNEADVFEPDAIGAFWGAKNYERLVSIKEQLDPGNLLSVHQGVGSVEGDRRFSCYPPAPVLSS